ncbi:tail fiber protein [Methylovirgula sp. HY1]|uniref:tail fiber protein n=1 Tax=Methylovirgula sp. HY1 TaxID=2822761 RepID=UPI001C5B30D3|nr:tail fiber protein [Methylovirgula sp. HY1]QXX74221.1 hypothetical protein MHY1_01031 [Methylovirgula sp. HY1]
MLKRLLLGVILFVAMAGSAVAGSNCMPVAGIFTAVQEQQYINAALHSINSSNAGASAPQTDCSNTTLIGQPWLDTAQTPWPYGLYDGTQYVWQGSLDPTNHIWIPVQGGGVATLTAATVTDLCQTTPQNYLTISGSTPITSFGASCGLGQWKFLQFSGSGQINYSSANILTPANQNISTANGDGAIAVNLGAGLWNVFSYHSAAAQVPIGAVVQITYATPDKNYILCIGQALSTTTYPALFAKIGYTYGGSGTTFYAPNYSGYYLVGADNMSGTAAGRITNFNADSIGASGGAQSVYIAASNLPSFSMSVSTSFTANELSGHSWMPQTTIATQTANVLGYASGCCILASFGTNYNQFNAGNYVPQTNIGYDGAAIGVSGSATYYGSSNPLSVLPPTKVVYFEMRVL